MIKVALLGDYPLDPNSIHGGVQAAFTYLVAGLAKIPDLQIHVLTLKTRQSEPTCIQQGAVSVHVLPSFRRFERVRRYKTYQAMLKSYLSKIQPSLIHAQDTMAHAYVALNLPYPAVVTVHGIRQEDGKYYSSLKLRLRNYFDSWVIERSIMRNTQYLIAISKYVTSYFAHQLSSTVQVHYISNAIDENFFRLPASSDNCTVLFAGRVIPRKRVLDLIRAFAIVVKKFPQAQLRIAGEYESDRVYANTIMQFIDAQHLTEQVHLLGALSETRVFEEFSRCDILALSSIQETTPMVIAQAMAAGKPVVATPVGGVTEMVSNGKTGFLVPVGDIEALANALLRLLQNVALRDQFGVAAYDFALAHYHTDIVAQRTYDVYRSMMKV